MLKGGPHFQVDVPKVGFIFKSQTRGLETWMASIPRTSVSFLYFFSFTRPAHSRIHTKKKIQNRRGKERIFVFHLCNLVVS